MSKVYLSELSRVHNLLEGLRRNVNLVSDKGLDNKFIDQMEHDSEVAKGYNAENEKLRMEIKEKTIRANRQLFTIKNQVKEAKKIIKHNFPQEKWIDFGIADKR